MQNNQTVLQKINQITKAGNTTKQHDKRLTFKARNIHWLTEVQFGDPIAIANLMCAQPRSLAGSVKKNMKTAFATETSE